MTSYGQYKDRLTDPEKNDETPQGDIFLPVLPAFLLILTLELSPQMTAFPFSEEPHLSMKPTHQKYSRSAHPYSESI